MVSQLMLRRISLLIVAIALLAEHGIAASKTRNVNPDFAAKKDAIVKVADRLISQQNPDGGWNWYGSGPSDANLYGVTALGLLNAYQLTGNRNYLNAAKLTADHLMSIPTPTDSASDAAQKFYASDIIFLYEFGQVYDSSAYGNKSVAVMGHFLTGPSRFNGSGGCSAQNIADYYHNMGGIFAPPSGISEWDVFLWTTAAKFTGNDPLAAQLAQIAKADVLDPAYTASLDTVKDKYYALGLAGALAATSLVGIDNSAIATKLVAEQNADGSITANIYDGINQTTAYSALAFAASRNPRLVASVAYLVDKQRANGGWIESDGKEYTEGNSENIQAIFSEIYAPGTYYYGSIQSALNAAVDGDTINITSGTYNETLNLLNKTITVRGAGVDSTIVNARALSGYAIQNFGPSSFLGDFMLKGTPNSYGFKIASTSGITLENIKVDSSYRTGIDLNTVTNAILSNVEIRNTANGFGLMILNSHNVRVVNGIRTSGNAWGGVSVQTSTAVGTDSVTFSGNFDATEDLPLLLEEDPYSGNTYAAITNVSLPVEFGYVVYTLREKLNPSTVQNYRQWFYFANVTGAKTFAQSAAGSTTYTNSGVVAYDLAQKNFFIAPGMKIQDAVDAASAGDTITLDAGTYAISSRLVVNKSISLVGENETATVIDASANGTDYGILISGSNVALSNFTIKPPLGPGVLGTSNGGGYAIHVSNTPSVVSNILIDRVTVKNGNRSGIDLNGVDNATVRSVTTQNAAYGNGMNLTGVHGADISNVTTGGNAWGGIAVYCSDSTQAKRASDNIVIDGSSCTITESNKIYAQNEFGFVNTNITVNGYDYVVKNGFNAASGGFTWYQNNLADAVTVASALVNLAWPGASSSSYIRQISTGIYQVASGMAIQAAINAATGGDVINVAAGTYDETIDLNKRITLQGAGSGDGGTVLTRTVITNPAPYPTQVDGATYSYNPVVIVSASGIPDSPVLLRNLKIRPRQDLVGAARQVPGILLRPGDPAQEYAATYSYVELNNVRVIGTQSFGTPESGVRIDGNTSLYHFVVTNCEFNNMGYGMIFHNNYNAANPSTVQYVEIDNTTFDNNSIKGFYAEKLSDATFNSVTAANNGDTALSPTWAIPSNAGIEINLKYGTYRNIVFNNLTVTGNGIGSVNGGGLAVKARGTGNDSSYSSNPAILEGVAVSGGSFTGNTVGIRLGEPGKSNTEPADLTVSNAIISQNTQFGLSNELSGVTATATGNWWGNAGGPRNVSTNSAASGDAVSANVRYSPWWDRNYSGIAHPWVWDANSDLLTAVGTVSPGDTLNYLGSYTGDLKVSKNVVVNFAMKPVLDSVVVDSGNLVLSSPIIVSSNLNLTNGNIIASDTNKIVLDTSAANPVETSSGKIIGTVEAVPRNVGTDSLHLLGIDIQPGKDDIGKVAVQRTSGDAGIVTISDKPSIAVTWNIQAESQPTKGRDVVFSWLPDFDNNVDTTSVVVYRNEGSGWQLYAGPFRVSGVPRRLTVRTTGFSTWTIGSAALPALSLNTRIVILPSVKTGQWKDTIVTLTNTGSATLNITDVASTKSYCSARPAVLTIPPGQSQNDTIRFAPDSIGARNAFVVFTSNATTSPDSVAVSGFGVGTSILALSNSSVAFPSVQLGQWKDSTISIANSGNDTLKITNIASLNAVFSARPTAITLPPGQFLIDTVRFVPAAIGSAFGKILITSNAPASPDTISVSGFGFGIGTLQLGVRTIPFGATKLGQWKDTSVTVFNGGSDTLKITNIAGTKSYFTVRPATLTIPPGQTLSDTIRFIPDSIGVRSAFVLLTSNASTSPDTINVTGYGFGTPALTLSTSALTFPSVKIGQWKDSIIAVMNSGDDTLKVTGVASSKSYYSARPAALTIPPGQAKSDTIRFAPDSIGTRDALILFTSNDGINPDTLIVHGHAFGTPVLALNTSSITFPSVKIGQWKDSVITVTNSGNDTLKITSVASIKSYYSARPAMLTIPPGQSKNDTIRFTPDSIGIRSSIVLLTSNDGTSPDTIVVTGYGTGTAVLALSPRNITFPTVGVGQRKDTIVTVANSGNDTLKIMSIAVTRNYFSANPTSLVIPPGQSRMDTIRFVPDSAGIRSAFIVLTSNASTSPDTITVSGNGTTTGVVSFGSAIPKEYILYQNYPNPFNPSTTIRFGVPVRSHVRIDVYNVIGQRVEQLVDEDANAGYFEKVWKASRFASGFYIYRIEATALDDPGRHFVSTKKLLLLK
jgi:DNA polymerase III delta prime subunit